MKAVSRLTVLLLWGYACPGLAQSIVPAADGTGTTVIPEGHQIQIGGGTRSGQNLFHSFDRFNLDANQTATFFANPGTEYILGRVVSGEASRINGLIQVNGNASLILMNPAGILFGSTARLDVPASFTATTANRIRLGSRTFSASGSSNYAGLNKAPSEFDFLGSSGIFNAGTLVAPQNISLLGGTVLNIGILNGQTVTIAAVPDRRSLRVTPEGSLLSLELPDSGAVKPTISLPELLTGGDLKDATQAVINDGIPTLTQRGTTIVSGEVSGAKIQIAGDRIGLIDATIHGESIQVGGDQQGLGAFPRSQFLFRNAATQIEGKNVVLWSDQGTRFRKATTVNNTTTVNNGLIETPSQRALEISQASLIQSNAAPILKQSSEAQQPTSIATELERSLSAQFSQYYGFDSPKAITLKEIQSTLAKAQQFKAMRSAIVYAMFVPKAITPAPKSGEVLTDQIEPVTPLLRSPLKQPDDRLELLLVTATGQAVRHSTTATRAQVVQQAKLFRLAVSDVEDQGYLALSKQFYQWLVEPLEAQLQREEIQGLIYCLDEGLRTLPIAALSDGQNYLIDRYAVSVIPSVTLFNREIHTLSNQTVLAMGIDHFQQLEPLPAVPTELKLISEQIWKGTQFLNQNFTLQQMLQERQRTQAGILHLATHAQFNPGSPDRSFIQLWNEQIKLSQMSQIAWSNPTLHLLVLSACETAIDSAEAELGFTGLATAAGVHSVLGSLWDISDVGTLALMSEFYTHLQKTSTRAEALRRAQAALRNGTVRIENGALVTSTIRVALPPALTKSSSVPHSFQHPYYWAGFTLVGNPW